MISSFFAVVSRLCMVQRWSGRKSLHPEDVAQHVYQCARLAHLLAVIGNTVYGKTYDIGYIAIRSLCHEDGEAALGMDIASPIKYANPIIHDAIKNAESAGEQALVDSLPEELREAMRPYIISGSGPQRPEDKIIKAADVLCCLIKSTQELMLGNTTFDDARIGSMARAQALAADLPEVEYWLQRFYPAFSMSLDAQSVTLSGEVA